MSSTPFDAEQDRMMEEECILVDLDDKPIGKETKRICKKFQLIKIKLSNESNFLT